MIELEFVRRFDPRSDYPHLNSNLKGTFKKQFKSIEEAAGYIFTVRRKCRNRPGRCYSAISIKCVNPSSSKEGKMLNDKLWSMLNKER